METINNNKLINKFKKLLTPETYRLLKSLNNEEAQYLEEILKELSNSGDSPKLKELWESDYKCQPVSIKEFLENPFYLGNFKLYPRWKEELCKIFGDPNKRPFEVILTGPIRNGKTTAGYVCLLRLLYEISCLRNPQEYFGLLPGTPIVFGIYNVYRYKAEMEVKVLIKSFLDNSPYFREVYKRDKRYTNQLAFPNDVYVITGSSELHALGENLFAVLIDEANFMKRSEAGELSQARALYLGTVRRIKETFVKLGRVPGLVILISSKKHESDFLENHIRYECDLNHTHICDFPIWEAKPDAYSQETFLVQVGDRYHPTKVLEPNEYPPEGARVIKVPVDFKDDFIKDPEGSLRDLAGISTFAYRPLISDPQRLWLCVNKEKRHPFYQEYVVADIDDKYDTIDSYFDVDYVLNQTDFKNTKSLPHFIHIDLGVSDCFAGLACVHILKEVENPFKKETTTYSPEEGSLLWFDVDFVLQIRYNKNRIDFEKIRQFIFYLRRFGYNIKVVTSDSYQSEDTLQILTKNGFETKILSVDKDIKPYLYLRSVILDGRIQLYKHETLFDELLKLQVNEEKDKVTTEYKKDIADALCGAVYSASQNLKNTSSPFMSKDYKPVAISGFRSYPVNKNIFSEDFKNFNRQYRMY